MYVGHPSRNGNPSSEYIEYLTSFTLFKSISMDQWPVAQIALHSLAEKRAPHPSLQPSLQPLESTRLRQTYPNVCRLRTLLDVGLGNLCVWKTSPSAPSRHVKTNSCKARDGKTWQSPKFFTEENCFVPSKATQTTHPPSFGRSTSRRVKGFWVKHRLCQILKVSMTTSRNSISRIWSNLHPKKDKWIGNLQSNLRPAAQVPTRIYQYLIVLLDSWEKKYQLKNWGAAGTVHGRTNVSQI